MNSGILVYGYSKNDADIIYTAISSLLQQQIFLKSANGKESFTIENLIESSSNDFEDKTPKIIMFIDIKDSKIKQILGSFPSSVTRPIFCGLTEHNIAWSFSTLKDHLLEEQEYWNKQKNPK